MAQPLEIDYSGIKQPETTTASSWRPPAHKFFGKRDPQTGMMEEEPIYVHQKYPQMIYKKKGERVVADVVLTDEELAAKMADGWVDNPGKLGYPTAPSFEELQAMKAEELAALQTEEEETGDTGPEDELVAKYTAKFGKKPHWKMTPESIAAKLAE